MHWGHLSNFGSNVQTKHSQQILLCYIADYVRPILVVYCSLCWRILARFESNGLWPFTARFTNQFLNTLCLLMPTINKARVIANHCDIFWIFFIYLANACAAEVYFYASTASAHLWNINDLTMGQINLFCFKAISNYRLRILCTGEKCRLHGRICLKSIWRYAWWKVPCSI